MNGIKTATVTLWFTLTCLIGFGMFIMKNQVHSLEQELNRINSDIQTDIKSIHVLRAEWSHLNSPSRLKQLVEKHSDLNPAKAEQIINYSALPFEHDNFKDGRKQLARKNVGIYAERNKAQKVLVNN